MENFIFFDTETTGLDPQNCDLIEVAALKVTNKKVVEKFQSLVRPPGKIPAKIEEITGISNEEVRGAPDLI